MNRYKNLDILKAVCAFLIICIHSPFPGESGLYFQTFTRVAVPIFFMITGYFYTDTIASHKEFLHIKRILFLILVANLLFFFWNMLLAMINGNDVYEYISSTLSVRKILIFLLFNESPMDGHLWYLSAILYVLLIVYFADKLGLRKILYFLTPVLLITDLILGKYSLLFFHREFPYFIVRNFLFNGLPFFCIGALIREKELASRIDKKTCGILVIVFTITSVIERFLLVSNNVNATRDHYLSTTFLSIFIFLLVLKCDWKNEALAIIGRKYSTWLYIIHPIFLVSFRMIAQSYGFNDIYPFFAPFVVYIVTVLFLIVLYKIKRSICKSTSNMA